MLTTLVPVTGCTDAAAGDEFGRTQRGNNNAYCQDNEISWLDWSAVDSELLAFVARLSERSPPSSDLSPPSLLRRSTVQRRRWASASRYRVVHARPARACPTTIGALGYARTLAVFLNGDGSGGRATDRASA
jgi:pullulanase/glycogen debranching enzyme